ncbi:hypothetical protein Poly41_68850 [Novipirellula artificiosorum]|uniref:Uncharacterized protein n=1 Tax=Novipirellula artificiosorum TaxID=2528016 RepID=A0A5C6CW28_9BACT|nr:hypothetical protein Poly41_68850 [Novipirellula artificiosorum]
MVDEFILSEEFFQNPFIECHVHSCFPICLILLPQTPMFDGARFSQMNFSFLRGLDL